MKRGVIGVYLITCNINGKKYIGASNDVGSRISQHFGTQVQENHGDSPLYKDIRKYGRSNFEYKLLEETTKLNKLSREQYWYDKLKPEYNFTRPRKCMFNDEKVRQKSIRNAQTEENIKARKKLFNTEEYRNFFRTCHPNIKPVDMYKDGKKIKTFVSVRETGRWLDKNTKYKSKNKASKVSEVCKGTRPTAFGYTFEYSTKSVETISKESR